MKTELSFDNSSWSEFFCHHFDGSKKCVEKSLLQPLALVFTRKNVFACLFSVYTTIDLSRDEQVYLMRPRFKKYVHITPNVAFSFENSVFCKRFCCYFDTITSTQWCHDTFWLFCELIKCQSDRSSLVFPIYFTRLWILYHITHAYFTDQKPFFLSAEFEKVSK